MRNWIFLIVWVGLVKHGLAFRVLTGSVRNGSYPRPYEKGFVGVFGDPNNFGRERINEGALETGDQEVLYEGVSPRQSCPGMVGPFSDGSYYCSAREFGYCDRRSGTCFCNAGYKGIDCTECQDTHFKIGYHCFPKKLCPDDCSGAGTCNYNNGTCTCLPHRTGSTCDTLLCSIYSNLCLTCTETECLQCAGGYYLTGDSRVCGSCYDFDPRCAGCIKEEGCTVCADATLTSVRRSGYRSSDLQLPDEEINREFSITLPFGTKSPESFAEAESYFVASTADKPLKNSSVTCSQGLSNDSSWSCRPLKQSHIVCGHYGIFTFLYPNYEVSETANYIRMYVQRSGGGYGDVTINYYIKHYSTNDSDIVATAPYTTGQQLSFEQGVVQRSFLITILDDNLVEENETFQVVLETPEGGGSVGAQFRANVTIIDDDLLKTSPKSTKPDTNSTQSRAGEVFTVIIQAKLPSGEPQTVGGDRFLAVLENDMASVSVPGAKRQTSRTQLPVQDLGDGRYKVYAPDGIEQQGVYQLRMWHALPNSIQGEYYYDAFFENLAVKRLDHNVNFTWSNGRLTPRGSDYISIRWRGAVLPAQSGSYQFAVNADDLARLWVGDVLLLDHMHERSAYLEPSRSMYLVAGQLYEIVLEYVEINGEAYAQLMWGFNGGKLSVIPQSNFYSLFEIDGSPQGINIISSYTSANRTEIYGDGLYSAVALVPATFTIYPRDQYGNLRDDDEDYYSSSQYFHAVLSLISSNGYGGVGSSVIYPVLTYNPVDHSFQGVYTPLQAGTYQLNLTYQSYADGPVHHLAGSPFLVEVTADSACGPFSNVLGLPTPLYAEAGYCYNFTVVLRDCSSNLLLRGGDTVQVYMFRVDYYNNTLGPDRPFPLQSPSQAPTMLPTSAPSTPYTAYYDSEYPPRISDSGSDVVRYGIVSDLGNGNYSVRICPVIAGIHEVHVLFGGQGVSNQPVRVLDRFFSTSLPSGSGSYLGQYIADSPYKMVVSHTKASVITSTVQGDGLVLATTAVSSFILLTVRDPYDNVLRDSYLHPNVSLKLDKSPSAYTSVWDYNNGSYLLEYVPELVGLNYISIYVNGFQIKNSPFNITVKSGQVKSNYSYAAGPGLYSGETGKVSYFTLYAYDGDGNRKAGYSDQFVYVVSGANNRTGQLIPCPSPRDLLHPICDPNDLEEGYYFGQFTPSYIGSITVQIYLNTSGVLTQISNSPFVIIVTPSEPKAESSDITGTLYSNQAGVMTTLDVQLRDYFGNKLDYGGWEMEMALIGVAVEWGTVEPFQKEQGLPNQYNYKGFYKGYPTYYGNIADHFDGTYTLSYKVPKTGDYVLRLSLAERGLNLTFFNDTQFGHLYDRDTASEDFVLSLDGRAVNYGNSYSWTGDLGGVPGQRGGRDSNTYFGKYKSLTADNIAIDLSLTFPRQYVPATQSNSNDYNFRQQYWSARWTGMLTPLTAEVYKFYIDIDANSELRMYIGGLGVETNLTYKGELVANITLRDRTQTICMYNFTDMKHREVLVEFVHYTRDAHLSIQWETISIKKAPIPSTAFTHWHNMSHYNLTIYPAPLCSKCSTAYGQALQTAKVGYDHSFLVYARDVFGNLIQKGGSGPAMFAVGNDGVAFRGKVTDYGNSTYLIRYYPTQAGVFRMYVTIGCCPSSPSVGYPAELEKSLPLLIQGAPFLLTIQPDNIAIERSIAVGRGLVGGLAGELLSFTIIHRDRFNNPTTVRNGTLLVNVVFTNAINGDTLITNYLNINILDSNTTVQYILNRAGRFVITVQLATTIAPTYKNIIASPFSIHISPTVADAKETVCRGVGIRSGSLNRTSPFEIVLHDQYHNQLGTGGNKFFVRVYGDANFSNPDLYVAPTCRDNLNGVYHCQYQPRYASGEHRLVIRLLQQQVAYPGGAGLSATYFDSADGAWDVYSVPRLRRIDSLVQFKWSDGVMIDELLGKEADVPSSTITYAALGQSVRWEGYVIAPRQDSFTFRAVAENLNVSIFLDSVLVFDSDTNLQKPFAVVQYAAYEIRVLASTARPIGAPLVPLAINLLWSTTIIVEQPVAQFFLYPAAEEVASSPFLLTVYE